MKPGAPEWEHKATYKIMWWARGMKFGNMMCDQLTINGVNQNGDVVVRAPYCGQHAARVRVFNTVLYGCLIAMFVVALIVIALWIVSDPSLLDDLGGLIAMGGILFFAFCIALGLAALIDALIVLKKPAYRDYPSMGRGHWGLAIGDVRTDQGMHGVGPVRYFLTLKFLSPESARRFLAAHPQAKVTKGEKLLAA